MSDHLIQKNYNFIRKLPEWAKTFAIKYCSNTASTFIFHGNIRDFLPQRTEYASTLSVCLSKTKADQVKWRYS